MEKIIWHHDTTRCSAKADKLHVEDAEADQGLMI